MSRPKKTPPPPKHEPTYLPPSETPSEVQTENESSIGYMPPPPPDAPPLFQEQQDPKSTQSPPPSETVGNPSFGKSKPTLKPQTTKAKDLPPRPGPQPVLGQKALEPFAYSATYDSDEEFLARYGEPNRAEFMLAFHGEDPQASNACSRLKKLLK